MSRVTIDDVAHVAGVSIKTVSRVVNQEPNVRESTRARVEAAIAKLNYRPNVSARKLASQRSYLIGLIYDDPSHYEIPSAGYVISMQLGALQACRKAHHELLIHPCNYRSRHIADELKARTPWYGSLRNSIRFLIASVLLRRGERAAEFLTEVERAGKLFREHWKTSGQTFEVLAILALQGQSPDGRV